MGEEEEETVTVITDINKICRTCLSERNQEDLKSLYENNLGDMLLSLADIKVRFLNTVLSYWILIMTFY